MLNFPLLNDCYINDRICKGNKYKILKQSQSFIEQIQYITHISEKVIGLHQLKF